VSDIPDVMAEYFASGTPFSVDRECSGPLEYTIKNMDRVLGRDSAWPRDVQTPVVFLSLRSVGTNRGPVEEAGLQCCVYQLDDVLTKYTPITDDTSKEQPVVHRQAPTSDPYTASQQLLDWIGITHAELAEITGIGRTTFFYWRRTGATPQLRTLRPLWRVYSLAQAVQGALGRRGAQRWFNAGAPTPRELLLAGDFDEAELRAHRVVFQPTSTRRSTRFFGIGEEDLESQEQVVAGSVGRRDPRQAERRAIPKRLGGDRDRRLS